MRWLDTTDLVLLVGTNPLPNYVVLKLLIQHCTHLQRVWLIHSELREAYGQAGTKEFAENIAKVFKQEFNDYKLEFRFVPLRDLSSAISIYQDLQEKMYHQIPADAVIHLNYTGGTKTMAVHVYRSLEENFKDWVYFSYLDGRQFKLNLDQPAQCISSDLLDLVTIELEDLIKLHSYQIENRNQNGLEVETTKLFIDLIEENKLSKYLQWQKKFRTYYYANDKFIDRTRKFCEKNGLLEEGRINESKVRALQDKFAQTTEGFILRLIRTLPEPNILDENGKLWIPDPENVINNSFCRRVKPVVEFLGGKWLEGYVANIIRQNLLSDVRFKDKYKKRVIKVEHNWEIKKGNKPFELDVIVLNGYQICGISCTTSDKEGLCKNKGFEILHRTTQIGGEEAKAILVTCLSSEILEDFYTDLMMVSGLAPGKFMVLGQDDLKPDILWRKISRYIWGDL